MDWDLLMIMIFVVILVAIVGGVIGNIAEGIVSYKKSQLAKGGDLSSTDAKRLIEITEQLQDRVRVLERIATQRNDPSDMLAAEIEGLRALPDVKTQESAA